METKPTGRLTALPKAPPSSLGDAGRKVWNESGELLTKRGMLSELHLPAFRFFCELHDEVQRINETLESEGEYSQSAGGVTRAHPGLNVKGQLQDRIIRMQKSFGLVPGERVKEEPPKPVGVARRNRG